MLEQWQLDVINSRMDNAKKTRFALEVDFRVATKIDDKDAQEYIRKLMTRNEATLLALEEELHVTD